MCSSISWDELHGQACDPKGLFTLADQEISFCNYLPERIKLWVNMKNVIFTHCFPSLQSSERTLILEVASHRFTEITISHEITAWLSPREREGFLGGSGLVSGAGAVSLLLNCSGQQVTTLGTVLLRSRKLSKMSPMPCFLFTFPSPSILMGLFGQEAACGATFPPEKTRLIRRQVNPEVRTEADDPEPTEKSVEAASLWGPDTTPRRDWKDDVTSGVCWEVACPQRVF